MVRELCCHGLSTIVVKLESNEAEVISFVERLCICPFFFIQVDCGELLLRMPFLGCPPLRFPPRRFHFLSNEIKFLSSSISLEFKHICQEANGLANSLAKQGDDKSFPFVDFTICSFFLGGTLSFSFLFFGTMLL